MLCFTGTVGANRQEYSASSEGKAASYNVQFAWNSFERFKRGASGDDVIIIGAWQQTVGAQVQDLKVDVKYDLATYIFGCASVGFDTAGLNHAVHQELTQGIKFDAMHPKTEALDALFGVYLVELWSVDLLRKTDPALEKEDIMDPNQVEGPAAFAAYSVMRAKCDPIFSEKLANRVGNPLWLVQGKVSYSKLRMQFTKALRDWDQTRAIAARMAPPPF